MHRSVESLVVRRSVVSVWLRPALLPCALVVCAAVAALVPPAMATPVQATPAGIASGAAAPVHPARQEPAQAVELPHVHVIGTGGTIAGRGQAGRVGGYRSGAIPIDELLEAIPAARDVARVTAEQYSNVGSTSLQPSDWLALAQRINLLFREGLGGERVDGVVVTHGTDALEETAYFLNLTVRSDRPVVMVGAMRPATAVSADGPLNLLNAIQVAADPASRGRGTMIVLNQEINAARDGTKTHAHRVQTFRARDWGLLGEVDDDGPVFYRRVERRHTFDSEFDVSALRAEELPRVDVAYTYNGADGTAIRAFVAAGARGVVIAGSGAGAMTRGQVEAAREAVEQGVFVVRSTHTGAGRITGSRGRFLGGDDLVPQKARILLMLALTRTDDPDEVARIFREY